MQNAEQLTNPIEVPEETKKVAELVRISPLALMFFSNQLDDQTDTFVQRIVDHRLDDKERENLKPDEEEVEEDFHFISNSIVAFINGELEATDPDLNECIEQALKISPIFKKKVAEVFVTWDRDEFSEEAINAFEARINEDEELGKMVKDIQKRTQLVAENNVPECWRK